MIDWNIQARAHACQCCGQAFTDKAPYHTLLFDDKTSYSRRDICADCWQQDKDKARAADDEPQTLISHWQGIYEAPPPPSELIRKETAETLLQKLVARNDPQHLASMFILAVMLERKRLLKVKDQTRHEGRRYFVYEHPKTGEVFTIVDPALSMDQLEQVQRDVSHLLEHGLEDPLTEQPPVASAPEGQSETSPQEAEPLSPLTDGVDRD